VVSNVAGAQVAVGQLGAGQVDGVSCVRSLNIGTIAKLDEYRLVVGANSVFVVSAEALQLSNGVIDLRFGD
jgi:outer membrane protein assembly factor BamA